MRIHDTLTRKTVELVPREPGKITMYVCGVTPYASAHIGHARTAVVYDLLKRYLRHAGYAVTHVSNYTDIDDKIIRRAQEQGVAPLDLSARYITEYLEDMAALNVLPPDITPRVSESIQDIIDLIGRIAANGYAYVSSDGVYFSVRKFSRYGRLSGRSVDEMRSGARVEVNEAKEDPLDFALWKLAKSGEISWDSPWGKGRPGWHIECSAMSLRHLGAGFDIHGGGEDLIFPHHENEIAQSEAALDGQQFVRYWMHSGMVNMGGEKMSKSLGNVMTVRELLEQYPGQVVRLYLLQTSYEKPLKFSISGFGQAFTNYERMAEFEAFLQGLGQAFHDGVEAEFESTCSGFLGEFDASLANNLNTSRALASVYEFITRVRRTASERLLGGSEASRALEVFRSSLWVLGLDQTSDYMEHKSSLLAGKQHALMAVAVEVGVAVDDHDSTSDLLDTIVMKRRVAREAGQYDVADQIRECLRSVGIALEDGVDGVRYRIRG
ncbi:cysteine--tRNA ligase [Candidatus Cryosericum septentrionale]|jgi:cysteinyl-tRNA synthetase|uniref:Cysteine--tRNA ligase n=1 Tax=Candidatus Cryosericum septentrionale TaxID=2290913 RepID=A0A398DRM9_9BACT|nr:cysteine--tRNA ligase [Candidatus Cryosericum septentrionale]RIE16679.1 cysteine--tRNA ligase [Candidatus Cryosericum septentrionale]